MIPIAGNDDTFVTGMAIDPSGNIVVTGYTASPGALSPTPGAYRTAQATGFVMKIGLAGETRFLSTFAATPSAVAVDSAGNIYLTGAAAVNFQTTPGAMADPMGAAGAPFGTRIDYECTAVGLPLPKPSPDKG